MNYIIVDDTRTDIHYEKVGLSADPTARVNRLRLLEASVPEAYGSTGVQGQMIGPIRQRLQNRIQQFRNR